MPIADHRRLRRQATIVVVMALTAVLGPVAGADAQEVADIAPVESGPEAIEALDLDAVEVAEDYDLSTTELRAELQDDETLHVDANGELLYIDPRPPGEPAANTDRGWSCCRSPSAPAHRCTCCRSRRACPGCRPTSHRGSAPSGASGSPGPTTGALRATPGPAGDRPVASTTARGRRGWRASRCGTCVSCSSPSSSTRRRGCGPDAVRESILAARGEIE